MKKPSVSDLCDLSSRKHTDSLSISLISCKISELAAVCASLSPHDGLFDHASSRVRVIHCTCWCELSVLMSEERQSVNIE